MKNILGKKDFDIVVIGAGPAGLSFCSSLKNTNLNIAIVDPNNFNYLANPKEDGREISITKKSKDILKKIQIWQDIDESNKYPLKEAKVFNGKSDYSLDFSFLNKGDRNILGHFIPNKYIRHSLFKKVSEQKNVTFIFENKVIDVNPEDGFSLVKLECKNELKAKLVISADSRYSKIRKLMDIPVSIKDFKRNIVLLRVQHSKPNNRVAMECFHYERTIATLPLGDYISSIVITIDTNKADSLLNLSDDDMSQLIFNQLKGRLGELTPIGPRFNYPLVGVHARKFYDKRYALIGDAAVGMHPVTAQGFNLGLQGQEILTDKIKEATINNEDIGSEKLLYQFSCEHMRNTMPVYYGTNAIVKLFTTENFITKPLRHFVLRAGNNFNIFKDHINDRLTK